MDTNINASYVHRTAKLDCFSERVRSERAHPLSQSLGVS